VGLNSLKSLNLTNLYPNNNNNNKVKSKPLELYELAGKNNSSSIVDYDRQLHCKNRRIWSSSIRSPNLVTSKSNGLPGSFLRWNKINSGKIPRDSPNRSSRSLLIGLPWPIMVTSAIKIFSWSSSSLAKRPKASCLAPKMN
jgi:hypothetical protein